jgi:hypothetical protein
MAVYYRSVPGIASQERRGRIAEFPRSNSATPQGIAKTKMHGRESLRGFYADTPRHCSNFVERRAIF